MSSFLTKTNLSSEDVKKCPNVLLFGILNCKTCPTMLTRKFWEVLAQTTACERDDLFLAPYLILGGKLYIYKMTVFFCSSLDFGQKCVLFFVFCCIFILPLREGNQCAIRARFEVASHLSTTPRWGTPASRLSQQNNKQTCRLVLTLPL